MKTASKPEALRELEEIDFTALFAAQIHDLKNLLFLLLNDLDQTIAQRTGADSDMQARLALLKYNGQLINDKLIQMLSLYRFNRGTYPVNLEYRPAAELIEDIAAEAAPLLAARAVTLTTEVPAELCWFYDRDLACGVINNAVHNALTCARTRIHLSAAEQAGTLAIRVEDDGSGFPPEILEDGGKAKGLDHSAGKTGLGLYFSSVCARLHRNKDKTGRIELANGGSLGGAVFTLRLP